MNKMQTKDLRMFGATDECMNQNQTKWVTIQAIVRLKNLLSQNISTIKDLDQKKESTVSNPITLNKEKIKDLLEGKIEVLYGIVYSYATANQLKELAQKVKLLSKGFAKKRETDIEPKVNTFLLLVRELLPKLSDYSLTEEMVVDAETTRDQFVALVGVPRNMRIQSSSTKKQMNDLINETMGLLTQQLDKLMLRFKSTDIDFYNSYIQSRTIVEPATRHREKTVIEAPVV